MRLTVQSYSSTASCMATGETHPLQNRLIHDRVPQSITALLVRRGRLSPGGEFRRATNPLVGVFMGGMVPHGPFRGEPRLWFPCLHLTRPVKMPAGVSCLNREAGAACLNNRVSHTEKACATWP